MSHPFFDPVEIDDQDFFAPVGGGADARLGSALGRHESEQGNIAQNIQALEDLRKRAQPSQWPQIDQRIAKLKKQQEGFLMAAPAVDETTSRLRETFPIVGGLERLGRGMAFGVKTGQRLPEILTGAAAQLTGSDRLKNVAANLQERTAEARETFEPSGGWSTAGEFIGGFPANLAAFKTVTKAVPALEPWLLKEISGSLAKRMGVSAAKNLVANSPFAAAQAAAMEDVSFPERLRQFMFAEGVGAAFGLFFPAPKVGSKTVGGPATATATAGVAGGDGAAPVSAAGSEVLAELAKVADAKMATKVAAKKLRKQAEAKWTLENDTMDWKKDLTEEQRSAYVKQYKAEKIAAKAAEPPAPVQTPPGTTIADQAIAAAQKDLAIAEASGSTSATIVASEKAATAQALASQPPVAAAPPATRPTLDKPTGGLSPMVAEIAYRKRIREQYTKLGLPWDESQPTTAMEAQLEARIRQGLRSPEIPKGQEQIARERLGTPPDKITSADLEISSGSPANPAADAVQAEILAKLKAAGRPSGAAYEAFTAQHADLFDKLDVLNGVKKTPEITVADITGSAVKDPQTGAVTAGPTHGEAALKAGLDPEAAIPGYITKDGQFLDRAAGEAVANAEGASLQDGPAPAPPSNAAALTDPSGGTAVSPPHAVAVAEQKPAETKLKYVKYDKPLEKLTDRQLDAIEEKLANAAERAKDPTAWKKITSDLSRVRGEVAKRMEMKESPIPTVERPHADMTPDELQVHRDAIQLRAEEISDALKKATKEERAALREEQKATALRMEAIRKEINFRKAGGQGPASDSPTSKMRTGEGTVGAGFDPSLFKKLGSNMYSGDIGVIALKEGLQNATDSTRGMEGATIDVHFDPPVSMGQGDHGGILRITDNGRGMSPQTMETALVDIGGSFKDAEGSSGGYGLAKVALFSRAQHIEVYSTWKNADGQFVETHLSGSGSDWVEGKMKLASDVLPPDMAVPTGTSMVITFESDVKASPWMMRAFLEKYTAHSSNPAIVSGDILGASREMVTRPETPIIEGTPIKDMVVPGADITVYKSLETAPSEDAYVEIHTLNNGIYQFSNSQHLEGKGLPRHITVDVKANVDINDPKYPFTTSREALKKDAQEAVQGFFKNIRLMARKAEVEAISRAVDEARPVPGTEFKVYSSDPEKNSGLMDKAATTPWVAQASEAIAEMVDTIFGVAEAQRRRLPIAEFGGIGMDPGWLGINIVRKQLKKMQNDIYLEGSPNALVPEQRPDQTNLILANPFAIYQEISGSIDVWGEVRPGHDVIATRMAKQTWATMIHEVAHQGARGHNEDFAGVFGRLNGDAAVPIALKRIDDLSYIYERALKDGSFEAIHDGVTLSWENEGNATGVFGKIGDENSVSSGNSFRDFERRSETELRSKVGEGDLDNVQGSRLPGGKYFRASEGGSALAGRPGAESPRGNVVDFRRAPSKLGNADLTAQITEIHRRMEIIDPQDVGPWSKRLSALMDEQASRKPIQSGPDGMPPASGGELRLYSHPAVTSFLGGFATGFFAPIPPEEEHERLSRAFMWGLGSMGVVQGSRYLLARKAALAKAKPSETIPGIDQFSKAVYSAEDLETAKIGYQSRFRQFYAGIVRFVDGIEHIPFRKDLPTQKNPAKLAEMYGSYAPLAERWMTSKVDFINPETGMPEPVLVGGQPVMPLSHIVEKLAKGDKEALGNLATALSSVELSGRLPEERLPMTRAQREYIITHAPEHLLQAAKELRRYNLAGAEIQRKMGLISDETFTKFESEEWYTPLHRIVEELEGVSKTRADRVPAKRGLYKRKGGNNKPVLNPVDVTMNMTVRILRSAEYNNILKNLVDRVQELPKDIRSIIMQPVGKQLNRHALNVDGLEVEMRKWANISMADAKAVLAYMDSEAINGKPGIISYFKNGEIQSYRVNSDLFQSVKALSPQEIEMAWRVLGWPARFASKGVVYHPGFTEAQFIMDSWHGYMLSEYGFRPGIDSIRGWMHEFFGSKKYQDLLTAGGPTTLQSLPYLQRETRAEAVRLAADKPYQLAWNQMKELKLWDAYKTILLPVANAARVGEYLRALDHGASTIEAAYAAQNLIGNYKMQGSFHMMRVFNYLTMFSRPAIAAMDKTLERSGVLGALGGRHARYSHTIFGQAAQKLGVQPDIAAALSFATKGFVGLTLPSMMLWYINKDDEEINQVRRTPMGQRYWFFRKDDKTIIRIRRPQVLGEVFGASAEAVLDKMYKDDPEGTTRVVSALWDDTALNVMPQIGVVPYSLWANKKIGFGSPLVPGRDENTDPAMQGRVDASLPSRIVADALADVSEDLNHPMLRTALSPAGIDYIFGTFGGMLGQDALKGLNAAMVYEKKGYLPSKEELPIVSRLVARYPSMNVKEVQEFYNRDQKVQAAAGTIKEYIQSQPELLGDYYIHNMERIQLIKLHDQIRQKTADLRRAIDDMRNAPDGMFEKATVEQTTKTFTELIIQQMKIANDLAKDLRKE